MGGQCLICGETLLDKRRQFCRECFGHRSEWSRKQRQTVKAEVLNAYGGKCQCCSEQKLRFLTIDHVNGSGNKHRESLGLHGGSEFYQWLRRQGFPKEFQVLCWNCNIGRAQNGGICPHKEDSNGNR